MRAPMRCPRFLPLAALLAFGIASGAVAQQQAGVVAAQVLGEELRCDPVPQADSRACELRLLGAIRTRVERDYLERHALAATAAEIAELEAYNSAFEQHDREQRTRKLDELEARLEQAQKDAPERQRLLEFRAILLRLAHFDADVAAGVVERAFPPREILRSWVESAKLDAALHAHYGGSVGIAASGPYAHGARAALLGEYLTQGKVIVHDPALARQIDATLSAQPRMLHSGGDPDFTPFWRRPIPASYMGP